MDAPIIDEVFNIRVTHVHEIDTLKLSRKVRGSQSDYNAFQRRYSAETETEKAAFELCETLMDAINELSTGLNDMCDNLTVVTRGLDEYRQLAWDNIPHSLSNIPEDAQSSLYKL